MKKSIKIVVLQRGWVFVGRYSRFTNGMRQLTEGKCIRVWGTTRGLGQIALDGPTSNTILDEAGTVRWLNVTGILEMDCNQKAWAKVFSK